MELIPALLVATTAASMGMVLVALFPDPIAILVRRYFPACHFEEGTWLLWGLLFSALLVVGCMAIYLVLQM